MNNKPQKNRLDKIKTKNNEMEDNNPPFAGTTMKQY